MAKSMYDKAGMDRLYNFFVATCLHVSLSTIEPVCYFYIPGNRRVIWSLENGQYIVEAVAL